MGASAGWSGDIPPRRRHPIGQLEVPEPKALVALSDAGIVAAANTSFHSQDPESPPATNVTAKSFEGNIYHIFFALPGIQIVAFWCCG